MDVEVMYNEMFYRYQLWYLKCIISQFPINTTRQLLVIDTYNCIAFRRIYNGRIKNIQAEGWHY